MGMFTMSKGYFAFSALHLVLFALALAVCGLYGTDLQAAKDHDVHMDSKWVFAVVVGALSAVTCIIYAIPVVLHNASVVVASWDLILFILWIALFGVFGKMYIKEDDEGDSGVKRMKSAVWVDLVSALLWLIASAASFVYWRKHRDSRSLFTGRAQV